MLQLYQKKFSVKDIAHLLYSLVYFDTADREKMPSMLWRYDWDAIKMAIKSWVKEFSALAKK